MKIRMERGVGPQWHKMYGVRDRVDLLHHGRRGVVSTAVFTQGKTQRVHLPEHDPISLEMVPWTSMESFPV